MMPKYCDRVLQKKHVDVGNTWAQALCISSITYSVLCI